MAFWLRMLCSIQIISAGPWIVPSLPKAPVSFAVEITYYPQAIKTRNGVIPAIKATIKTNPVAIIALGTALLIQTGCSKAEQPTRP